MDITITMNEEEIVTAIKDYLNGQDVPTAGKDVEVNMVAGRGANGHSAVISVKKENAAEGALSAVVPVEKPVVEKPVVVTKPKKETPVPAETQKPVNPAPPTELFDDPIIVEDPADENTMGEGSADALFEEAVPPEAQSAEVGSLFN